MKKVIVMVACLLTIGASNAQENTKKFELGCNIGMTTFTNYSGIPLFQDATDSYSNWSEAIHLGYRVNNTLFGINFQYGILNTSDLAMNETAVWWDFAPMLLLDAWGFDFPVAIPSGNYPIKSYNTSTSQFFIRVPVFEIK